MHYQAEVIVIGAGPGGLCAALSAAREGRSTILISDRPVFGGNSSSEVRVWTRGATGGGNLFAEEMGIWGELKLRNLYTNPEGNPVFWDDVLLDAVWSQPDLTFFLNTHITSVTKEGERICSVSGFQMGSERQLEFSGAFFIDATGDGTIGALCGVPYHIGKEAAAEYGEDYAPGQEEHTTFGNTIFYFTYQSERPVSYVAPDYAYSIGRVEEFLDKGGRIVNEKMNGCDYWWFETGGMKDTIGDAQEITLDLKRLVAGVWNYIKNSGKFEADYLTLSWQGNLPGKRESRRMITESVVRQQDVLGRVGFADTAFYGGWYMDFHPSDGIHTEEDFCVQIPVQVYGMPFRCLYNRSVSNLLFAGRNIGATHVAFASSRIMNTCAMCGQAAGLLASYCTTADKKPVLLSDNDIVAMQQMMINNDMLLPGVHLVNTANLARQAEVFVSSVQECGAEEEFTPVSLKERDYLVIPSRAGTVEILLEADEETLLSYECYAFDLPSKLALDGGGEKRQITVCPGKAWHTLDLVETDKDQFLLLVIKTAEHVTIWTGEHQLTGFLGGSQDSAGVWYPCVRFSNTALYGGAELKNGYNRLWQAPNLWISGTEEQPSVVYSWPEEQMIRQIDLFFNPDLTLELNSSRASSWNPHHKFAERRHMPPELVRDFAVYGRFDDEWVLLAEVTGNWRRKQTVRFAKAVKTNQIMVQINATYGADHGEIFEIAIY